MSQLDSASEPRDIATQRCWRCGNDASSCPLCPDIIEDESRLVCGVCWLKRNESHPSVQFFLERINEQIPEVERGLRDFHHTIPEWIAAVKSLKSLEEMRRFEHGCILWHAGPGFPLSEAVSITHDNLGCVVKDLSLWQRLKWWWACGVTTSELFHT